MRLILWFLLLLGGNLLLVAGLFLTRQTWRADIKPFGRGSPIFHIMLHPEQFATPDRLREIRLLNLVGGTLLCAAVAFLAFEAFGVMLRT